MNYAFGPIYINLKVIYIEIIGNLRIDGNGGITLQSVKISYLQYAGERRLLGLLYLLQTGVVMEDRFHCINRLILAAHGEWGAQL